MERSLVDLERRRVENFVILSRPPKEVVFGGQPAVVQDILCRHFD